MSKVIWESDTEQGIIDEDHIVAIKSASDEEHTYEMYDKDCQVYALSDMEFQQIAGQIDHDDFMYLEAAGVKMWLSKENFTDAICNPDRCEIGGWDVAPLIFTELMKFIKTKKERQLAKHLARKKKVALRKTPDGILKLIDDEKAKSALKIAELQSEHDFLMKTPEVMV